MWGMQSWAGESSLHALSLALSQLRRLHVGIHPEWYPEAKVVCNGQEVMVVSGTKPSYNVEIYSGNHPFFQGQTNTMIMDDGALNKFKKKFAGMDDLFEITTGVCGVCLLSLVARKCT